MRKNLRYTVLAFLFIPALCNAQIITTIAGTGTWGCSASGGFAVDSVIGQINGITVDTSGNIFISCEQCDEVRKINTSGVINDFAGTGYPFLPNGLATDKSGNVYICDNGNSVILKVTPTGIISTIAGNAAVIGGGYTGDGGPAIDALLSSPAAVAVDSIGNIYIADAGNNVIRKISASGTITRIAGTGVYGFSGDGGLATDAGIPYPYGVAVDHIGNVYIVDGDNSRIRKVSPDGIINTIAGNGTYGYSGDGGPADSAELAYPMSVAADNKGNIFIADSRNNVIRKVDSFGTISTFAGNGGGPGDSGDGGVATAAQINDPEYITIDKNGYLYIGELNGARVRKIDTCLVPHIDPIAGIKTICTGMSITLSDSTTGGTWSTSDPSIATINTSGLVTSVSKGVATISYSVTNSCATMHVSKPLIVGPYAGVISGGGRICPGEMETLTNNVPGGTWLSSDTTVATISDSGFVTVNLHLGVTNILYIVSDSCGIDTAVFSLNDTCIEGLANATNSTYSLSVFPNPAHDELTVTCSAQISNVCISNLLGQVVFNRDYHSASINIDIADLPENIYLVKVNGTYVRKFIKQR